MMRIMDRDWLVYLTAHRFYRGTLLGSCLLCVIPAISLAEDNARTIEAQTAQAQTTQAQTGQAPALQAKALVILPGSRFEQGGLVRARTVPGARVRVDGEAVRVGDDGFLAFGFHRDDPDSVVVAVELPNGADVQRRFEVAQRRYDEQRIDGLASAMVTPPQAVLERIANDQRRVRAARTHDHTYRGASQDFIWPVEGRIRITSVYGSRRILNGEPRQPHYGLDIAAPTGRPVVATADGVVRLADTDLYYTGGTVIIDHGFGVSSTYLHLSEVDVAVGERVARGQRIGAVGATGRVTGAHLCFRYNWFDKRLDPALLLPASGQ